VDLAERGAGALIGKRQSGLTDIGMEAIKNRKLVEIAKSEAEKLIAKDPTLSQHHTLTSFLDTLEFHGE
jgi:RecG-like helicase